VEQQRRLRAVIMRGGTSRAVFLMRNELPSDSLIRDRVILGIFGSPDVRQIDGLGGADIVTSKLAIIGPATREDADVDYTFGQVGIAEARVDYRGNCGNISSAVGPFAVDEGIVEAREPVTTIRIHQTNTKRIIVAEVPVVDGKAAVIGDFAIDGCPGTGARIMLNFADSAGSSTGKLLPTRNVRDLLDVKGVGKFDATLVDAANPTVFVRASDLGLTGTETPAELEANKAVQEELERIRARAGKLMGLIENEDKSTKESPHFPYVACVGKSRSHKTFTGKSVAAEEIDFVSRLISMQKVHKTYPVTGGVCTGVAAAIEGSLLNEVCNARGPRFRIGHPSGIIDIEAEVDRSPDGFAIRRAAIGRTARRIMEGHVFVRSELFGGGA
jgi:2-methylaconitate cis-trans-isomerase PrpF